MLFNLEIESEWIKLKFVYFTTLCDNDDEVDDDEHDNDTGYVRDSFFNISSNVKR